MITYIRGSAMQGSGDLHIKIGITGKKSDEFLPFLALKHPSALIWRVYKSGKEMTIVSTYLYLLNTV